MLVIACGDDDRGAPAVDGGVRDGGGIVDGGDMTVAPPASPAFAPCPAGWTASADGTCDPGAVPDDACPSGQAWFAGTGCTAIGGPCPAVGDFPDGLPDDHPILYVRAGAVGGDGSERFPYPTIRGAMGIAAAGTIIAVAAGSYDEPVRISDGVTVWGACPAQTSLVSSEPGDISYVVYTTRPDTGLRNLRVGPSSRHIGIGLSAGASMALTDVVVDGAAFAGVWVTDSTLTARGLVVAHTAPHPDDGGAGRGLQVDGDSAATVTHAAFEGNRDGAVMVFGGSSAELDDVTIRGTQPDHRGLNGFGVYCREGATVRLRDSLIDGSHEAGIVASIGATLDVDQIVIRDTHPSPASGLNGVGIMVQREAVLSGRRLVLTGGAGGVFLKENARATIEDAALRDNALASPLGFGVSLAATEGSTLEARRIRLIDNGGASVAASGGTLILTDASIAGAIEAGGSSGAVMLSNGVDATLTRLLLTDNQGNGVVASGDGTQARLEDIRVDDTRADHDGFFGRAIEIQMAAHGTLRRAVIDRNLEVAVYVAGAGTVLDAENVWVRDTQSRACAATTCGESRMGMGIGIYRGAAFTLHDFVIAGSALCGVHVADTASADLRDGSISGCPIGACVQVGGYDVDRLTDGVAFEDNEINLDSTELPIPDATELPIF